TTMARSAGCGGGHRSPQRARAPAIGITEGNPALVWSARERPAETARFSHARAKLAALHPAYYRLVINWAVVQPRPDAPPDWSSADRGCERTTAVYAVRGRARAAACRPLRPAGPARRLAGGRQLPLHARVGRAGSRRLRARPG